jgi:hypothetical protein
VKTVLTSLYLLIIAGTLHAQGFYSSNAWRTKRVELVGGAGASNFLGDLGGRDRVGSNFVWDLEWVKTRYAAHITYQYYLAEKIAIRPSFYFARVSGDDALTQERYRNHRNLNFVSNLYELSVTGEYQFLKEKIGNIYGVKTSTGKKLGLKSSSIGIYGVAGVGIVFYNPKGRGPNGANVALRKLGTEGQGLPGGPKKYKPATVVVPMGVGFRKSIGKDMGLKLELTHRFTFSDYIDDVSTNYYDNADIRASKGDVAAYLADPSNKNDGLNNTHHGLQRGDPSDKDSYMFLTISFYKRIKTKIK